VAHVIRWGIVGFGDIAAKAVAPAIMADPGSALIAICRRDAMALEHHRQALGVPNGFTDYGEMLNHGGLDAIYVATPVNLHASQTLAALECGLHVLVEKPMAATAGEAEAMVLRAGQQGLTLGVAYYHHFTRINTYVRELVGSGALGALAALHGNASSSFNPSRDDPGAWRILRSSGGGGPLMDLGSHRLETFHSLAGPSRQVSAFSDTRRTCGDVEDSLSMIVRYASGVQATLSSVWGIDPARGDYEVWCTHGHVNVPYARGDECYVTQDGETRRVYQPDDPLYDAAVIQDFVAGVANPSRHVLHGRLGLEVQCVIDAAYQSATCEGVVTLSPIGSRG